MIPATAFYGIFVASHSCAVDTVCGKSAKQLIHPGLVSGNFIYIQNRAILDSLGKIRQDLREIKELTK
jgi:hypothetical protein